MRTGDPRAVADRPALYDRARRSGRANAAPFSYIIRCCYPVAVFLIVGGLCVGNQSAHHACTLSTKVSVGSSGLVTFQCVTAISNRSYVGVCVTWREVCPAWPVGLRSHRSFRDVGVSSRGEADCSTPSSPPRRPTSHCARHGIALSEHCLP
jgi:hypothetical protein